jgi:hypothetical protein
LRSFFIGGFLRYRIAGPCEVFVQEELGFGEKRVKISDAARVILTVWEASTILGLFAEVAELADAHDSKSCPFGDEGSIPSFGTG